MADTANLQLPLMSAAQSQKHVTHNEAILMLDTLVQLSVIDRDLTTPPVSPTQGDRYIVGSGATGAWDDKDLNIAVSIDGAWTFMVPNPGWLCWIEDEELLLLWDAGLGNWVNFGDNAGLVTEADLTDGSITQLGVNTSPDSTNRLAVKSDAILFSHDDVTPGSGDMRVTVNKSAAGKDAGLFFQDGYSTRMIFGLMADDNTTLKTSPDGSVYKTVFTADKTTGGFDLVQHAKFQAYTNIDFAVTAATWTKVGFNNATHNDQNAFSAASNNFTAPQAGYYAFGATVVFKINGSNPSTAMTGKFYKNGSAVADSEVYLVNDWGNVRMTLRSSVLLKLAASDVIDFRVNYGTYDGYVEANTSNFWGCRIP